MPGKFRLYFETIRHLRPVQIYGRVWFRLSRPKPDLRPAPRLRALDAANWVKPARRRPSMVGARRFRFLNETHEIGGSQPAQVSRLWLYNLHYFDDLNAEAADQRHDWHRDWLGHWIEANPPGTGAGWEPYPASLRIVNWIKWHLSGNPLPEVAVQSLAVQVRWLRRRLEIHLLGNHLFANAKALVFAGCFFEGPEADAWLVTGLQILEREIPEQILPDGGQFELSTMYHALALEDLLDLSNLAHVSGGKLDRLAQALDEHIPGMRRWLDVMSHPDGEISFFNDAAFGISPPPGELHRYARALGFPEPPSLDEPCIWLGDSGYVRLQSGEAVALLDLARIGPDYLPGHAHADTLSFELSLKGKRLVVNSGTSLYGDSAERLRQRGTAAHNTVVVDGADSSEVWSGFRTARRAKPLDCAAGRRGPEWCVEAAHDGYRRLPGKPIHRRSWSLGEQGLRIDDAIEGGHGEAKALFHFHPDWSCELAEDGRSGLARNGGCSLRWRVNRGVQALVPSSWHPEFGLRQPSTCLELKLENGGSSIHFSWAEA